LDDEHATPEARSRIAAHTRETLEEIPGVRSLSVGTPADEAAARSWDLSIVLRFDSLEGIRSYREHPEHRRYVDEYMKPKMQVVKAWNFELG
jgi:hypothetical protein